MTMTMAVQWQGNDALVDGVVVGDIRWSDSRARWVWRVRKGKVQGRGAEPRVAVAKAALEQHVAAHPFEPRLPWVVVPGFGRWLVDGKNAVRDGRPRPVPLPWRPWLTPVNTGHVAFGLVAFFTCATLDEPPKGGWLPLSPLQVPDYDVDNLERARGLLAGLRVTYGTAVVGSERMVAVGRDGAGQPQAVVALWDVAGTVYTDGVPR
jgi:hypothetical protein